MNVWIDMDNSPHVYLLIPFIKNLEEKNYTTHITARDYAQTIELLNDSELPFTKIGKHAGANKFKKVINLTMRVSNLLRFAKRKNFSMAINHGSRAHALACKILGIPCFIGMDYEHTESKIFAYCATRIWIPDLLFPDALPFIGVNKSRVLTYAGIKEQFYLNNFKADPLFKQKHFIPADKILIVLRPPADMANYHNKDSEFLIKKVIENISTKNQVYTICTPRTPQQRSQFKEHESASFKVIDKALDGKNLAYYADIMISGGGTMNREAAYFGTQVYSIFSGQKPMLDLELQKIGLLKFIESTDDCARIQFKKKSPSKQIFSHSSTNQIDPLIDQFILLSNPK